MSGTLRARVRRAMAGAVALATPGGEGLRILTYHRVNGSHPRDRLSVRPEAFEAQMDLLARSGRPVVSLERAVAALSGRSPLPPGAVVLTFDDGFEDNLTMAVPILERHGFPATFFVVTGHVGSSETLDRYRGCCADDRMLGWDQVRALRGRGFEVGGHGRTHRELARLSAEEARDEIEGCARDLERETGARPRSFCYPRGSQGPAARRLVAAAGFAAACTVQPGPNRPGADLMALARTEVSGHDGIEDLHLKLSGGFDGWHRVVQRVAAWRGA